MTSSYQKSSGGGGGDLQHLLLREEELPVSSSTSREERHQSKRKIWILGGLLLLGVVLAWNGFFPSSDSSSSSSSSSNSNSDDSYSAFSLLGHKKGHDKKKKKEKKEHKSKEHEHHHELHHNFQKKKKKEFRPLQLAGYPDFETQKQYIKDLQDVDWEEVKADIIDVMENSQDWWPADYGSYGGLFVRLAWHSCGSYRTSDGRGGCDGGGQRFDPERSWPDNTNLDKARRLLEPVKHKHGNGLSWGDLFALAGTTAIKKMGGPVLGFCAGRVDVIDNSQTRLLGPTPEQDKWAHCDVQGDCQPPLGANTLGLIYVNPEGPMGEPDAVGAASTVRDVFGRMDWHGKELVALIGGGHTFGKSHGATTESPGDPPNVCPFAPWSGGVGTKAVTSGFEGAWTENPLQWDNDYFKYLVEFDWEPIVGPGGHHQWRVKGGGGPQAPSADPDSVEKQDIMMLTTDVSLSVDEKYKKHVEEFANDMDAFSDSFARAWYKLVTRDMGPRARCLGPNVPEEQHFQQPLPKPSHAQFKTDYDDVEDHIRKEMHKGDDDEEDGRFVDLAWQCASTYRATDHQGGCNGARIRFPPGNTWPINAGLNHTLDKLGKIKNKFGDGLSWADLIVLAGNVALYEEGAPRMEFCPGRTDAEDGSGWKLLAYGIDTEPATVDHMIDVYERRGQTAKEFVALTWRFYKSSKELGKVILDTSDSSEGNVLEQGLKFYPELRVWAEYYVSEGDDLYESDFADAWTKVMNADRFDGPIGNVCYKTGKDDEMMMTKPMMTTI